MVPFNHLSPPPPSPLTPTPTMHHPPLVLLFALWLLFSADASLDPAQQHRPNLGAVAPRGREHWVRDLAAFRAWFDECPSPNTILSDAVDISLDEGGQLRVTAARDITKGETLVQCPARLSLQPEALAAVFEAPPTLSQGRHAPAYSAAPPPTSPHPTSLPHSSPAQRLIHRVRELTNARGLGADVWQAFAFWQAVGEQGCPDDDDDNHNGGGSGSLYGVNGGGGNQHDGDSGEPSNGKLNHSSLHSSWSGANLGPYLCLYRYSSLAYPYFWPDEHSSWLKDSAWGHVIGILQKNYMEPSKIMCESVLPVLYAEGAIDPARYVRVSLRVRRRGGGEIQIVLREGEKDAHRGEGSSSNSTRFRIDARAPIPLFSPPPPRYTCDGFAWAHRMFLSRSISEAGHRTIIFVPVHDMIDHNEAKENVQVKNATFTWYIADTPMYSSSLNSKLVGLSNRI